MVRGTLQAAGAKALPVLALGALALLVYHFDAPVALAAIVMLAAGGVLLLRPEIATVVMVFLLYTNIPVIAYKYHGVPQAVAGAFMLLLLLPLGHHVVVRRERVRVDTTFYLMLLFLLCLLISSLRAKGTQVAAERIQTYVVEGVILYWLVINAVRSLSTLRRVLWTVLAAGGLLGGLSLYQEVTGSFHHRFGGLAQRNYEFLVLQEQLRADPDDPFLREQKASYTGGRSPRANGPIDEPNYFAQIMILLLPFAWMAYRTGHSRWVRFCAVVAGTLILSGIVVTYSRGALVALGLIVFLGAYLRWIRRSHILIGALLLALLVPAVASDYLIQRVSSITVAGNVMQGNSSEEADVAIQGRATQMMAAFQAWADHPVFGVGPGQYSPFYSVEYHQRDPRWKVKDIQVTRRAHSLYLEMAAEVGLVGLIVFLSMISMLMWELWRTRRRWTTTQPMLADLATAFLLSLTAFLITAVFLSLSYERYYWLLLAMASAALHAIRLHEQPEVEPRGPGGSAARLFSPTFEPNVPRNDSARGGWTRSAPAGHSLLEAPFDTSPSSTES